MDQGFLLSFFGPCCEVHKYLQSVLFIIASPSSSLLLFTDSKNDSESTRFHLVPVSGYEHPTGKYDRNISKESGPVTSSCFL